LADATEVIRSPMLVWRTSAVWFEICCSGSESVETNETNGFLVKLKRTRN
jgi:hypothetical protein